MQIYPGRLFVRYLSSIRIKLIFSLVIFVASHVVNAQDEPNTLSGWQQRQNWVKKTLLDIVGPFPEKTPLNAKIQRKPKRRLQLFIKHTGKRIILAG